MTCLEQPNRMTDKDDDLIMIDANSISHQNAEASGSGTNNLTDITPKDNTVIMPISTEVKKTKTRTIINRSQQYRLYVPVTAFTTEDVTESGNLSFTYMKNFIL